MHIKTKKRKKNKQPPKHIWLSVWRYSAESSPEQSFEWGVKKYEGATVLFLNKNKINKNQAVNALFPPRRGYTNNGV